MISLAVVLVSGKVKGWWAAEYRKSWETTRYIQIALALNLGSSVERRKGSSPFSPTISSRRKAVFILGEESDTV
jgi:hypothetical protein